MNKAPVRISEEGDRWTVYEDPGRIRVQHGFSCLRQGFAATAEYVGFRIQDTATAPLDLADAGTVFLNGWDVQYLNGDHHVLGLGSSIFNITEERKGEQYTLRWDAGGVLSDKNGDDGYKWCYRYTLVFWKRSSSAFDAVIPFQTDTSLTFIGANHDTALAELSGKFPHPGYGGPQVVLPRGFAQVLGEDHHILQIGFNRELPTIEGNQIVWDSQMVLKDKNQKRPYKGAELVTILSGQSAEMWQPRTVLHWTPAPPTWAPDWVSEPTELVLHPAEDGGFGCVGNGPEERLESYSVENVPFDYAIPVLTGWDMQYACTDHHIERLGVYLVEFDYVKDPNAATGTLNYTIFSTMRDDSNNGHATAQYKVSILGLNALGGGSDK